MSNVNNANRLYYRLHLWSLGLILLSHSIAHLLLRTIHAGQKYMSLQDPNV